MYTPVGIAHWITPISQSLQCLHMVLPTRMWFVYTVYVAMTPLLLLAYKVADCLPSIMVDFLYYSKFLYEHLDRPYKCTVTSMHGSCHDQAPVHTINKALLKLIMYCV